MNTPLSPRQIERAGKLINELERIENELQSILSGQSSGIAEPRVSQARKHRGISAAGRARIAAAARARWAKEREKSNGSTANARPARAKGKRTMSPESRARIAAAQKKRWAKFRRGK